MDIDHLEMRDLQKEAARALTVYSATNNFIHQFNRQAYHNSQNWYKAVIKYYIEQYGDLPSKAGPAKDVKLILE
jgi:hypothetical protein